ncbi:hypothetical protein LCGC14_2652040 [marine sediment metagenome]|uniref:Uncharacterized protein n=1 Tax=marine sediment metagenome TaxID=412755 RepID=A0A0F8ZUL1_9ZZZZ
MTNFGHVLKITREVGGKIYTYRSRLEYRWAVWCQLRKEQGIIIDWWFEDAPVEIETKYFKNKKLYLPDFTIQTDTDYEFEETKGWFPAAAYTKIRLTAEQYDNPITLIFAALISNSKNPSLRAQYGRAKRLEPYVKRIIYDADKTIFKKINYMFDL